MVFFGRRAVERVLRLRAVPCAVRDATAGMRCVARSGATDVKRGDAAPSPSLNCSQYRGGAMRLRASEVRRVWPSEHHPRQKSGVASAFRPPSAADGMGAHCKHIARLFAMERSSEGSAPIAPANTKARVAPDNAAGAAIRPTRRVRRRGVRAAARASSKPVLKCRTTLINRGLQNVSPL